MGQEGSRHWFEVTLSTSDLSNVWKTRLPAESTSGIVAMDARESAVSLISGSGIWILRPKSLKLRVKLTTGSVGSFTNLAGADGDESLFLWPAAIRSRPRENREAAFVLLAVYGYGPCTLLDLRPWDSAKVTCRSVEGRFTVSAAAKDET